MYELIEGECTTFVRFLAIVGVEEKMLCNGMKPRKPGDILELGSAPVIIRTTMEILHPGSWISSWYYHTLADTHRSKRNTWENYILA